MRPPMKPLKSLDEALAELLGHATPLEGAGTVSTFDADGRVLAQDCISVLHVPPLDNSFMDGYAVRCADVAAAGVELPVSQRIAAGSAGEPLQPGTAARIFTGAPVPAGADAVLMQEDCEVLEDGRVRINAVPRPG
ncbi:MAG: molybdopterin molybdenumtransferase MoeA, partial [Acidovorax sp.]